MRQPSITLRAPLFSCCVYVWKHADKVMYVGRSSTGIRRLNASHSYLPIVYGEADLIEFYTCRDDIASDILERQLIAELSPILNRQFQQQKSDVLIG